MYLAPFLATEIACFPSFSGQLGGLSPSHNKVSWMASLTQELHAGLTTKTGRTLGLTATPAAIAVRRQLKSSAESADLYTCGSEPYSTGRTSDPDS